MSDEPENTNNEPMEFNSDSSSDSAKMSPSPVRPTVKGGVIPVVLPDKASLYAAYMPFVKHGGLFIRSDKTFEVGDEVTLVLKLMDLTEKFTIIGKIAWITPKGAQGGLKAGVGVQFSEETPVDIRNKIETFLAGSSQSERRTDTM